MSSTTRLEAYVDKAVEVFMDTITARFVNLENSSKDGKPFEIVSWMQYFAFDVRDQLLYGERHGFIKKGYVLQTFQNPEKDSAIIFQ
jgi:hypothetical protein